MNKIPTIIPRGKQVLVQPDAEKARESEFGIITPDNVEQERKSIGTVLAVGPEIKDIEKGDRIIYGTYAGERLKFKESLKDVDYVILHDEDIIAFIED